MEHNEWYSRGYLPHRDREGLIQHVVFRLVDSMPDSLLKRIESELGKVLKPRLTSISENDSDRRCLIERYELFNKYLDAGHGSALLSKPASALIVQDTLLFYDQSEYQLLAWCIMPNHVHVLLKTNTMPLSKIVQRWKTYSAKEINRIHGRTESLWHREWFDRYIRNESHCRDVVEYIAMNPVCAGLVKHKEDWPWTGIVKPGPDDIDAQYAEKIAALTEAE
jgi:type I restriction enzyme R subunit/putative DNA methylase